MKNFDSIIFDIDGTLWDSTGTIAISWNKILEKRSDIAFRATSANLKGLFGNPNPVIAQMAFPEISESQQLDLIEECVAQEMADLPTAPGDPYPDMAATLRKLADHYKLFIVSNCGAGYIETFMETMGLTDKIVDHLCPGDPPFKYKAENIRMIMEKHGLTAPVYVGDTNGDCKSCKEAGLPFIYCEYGFGEVAEGDYIHKIGAISELLEYFLD